MASQAGTSGGSIVGQDDSNNSAENFCLKWNDFATNLSGSFQSLRAQEDLCDVTLAVDEDKDSLLPSVDKKPNVSGSRPLIRAHKLILSACSPFFQSLFKEVIIIN